MAQAVIFWHKRYVKMPKRKIKVILLFARQKYHLTLIDKNRETLHNFNTNILQIG